jgi:CRISPR-associated protein (TIGR03984 family)
MAEPTTLITFSRSGLSLADSLELTKSVFGCGVVIGFLSTPTEFMVVKLEGGLLKGPNGTVDLGPVFEARVFSNEAELRWLAETDGVGKAVVLAETELSTLASEGWKRESYVVTKQSCEYILWGRGTGKFTNGWGGVSAARIGTIPLPLKVEENKCAILKTIVYFCKELPNTDGNCVVLDERLLGLEVRDAKDRGSDQENRQRVSSGVGE